MVCDIDANAPADGMGTCVAEAVCARGPAAKEDVAFRAGPGGDSGVGWRELTIESSSGPCAADGRSCVVKRHLFPNGTVSEDRLANPTPEERKANPDAPKFTSTTRQVAPGDLRELDAILRSRDFRRDMRGAFKCARQVFDANLAFSISFADGTASEDITTCVIDPSTGPNLPRRIVELVSPK